MTPQTLPDTNGQVMQHLKLDSTICANCVLSENLDQFFKKNPLVMGEKFSNFYIFEMYKG